MKLNRLIITTVLGCIAIGTYAWASHIDEANSINKNLAFKELAGTTEALGNIQAENIIKVGANKYEKVYFDKDGVRFEPTVYDETYDVGEDVLEHKDLFRGRTTGAHVYTADEKIVLLSFNKKYPYASTETTVEVCVKDLKSGKVTTEVRYLNEVKPNQYRMNQQVFEINGKLIYVLEMGDESQTTLIYEVNEKDLTLKPLADITQGYGSQFVSDGQSLFTIISSGEKGLLLQKLDLETGEQSEQKIHIQMDNGNVSYAPERFVINDKTLIFFYGNEKGLEYFVFDRNTLEQKDTFMLASGANGNSENHGYGLNDWKLTEDKFYCIQKTYLDQLGQVFQFGVYNLEAQELQLEGYLPPQPISAYMWTEKLSTK